MHMTPSLRRFALTTHVASSVGLLGSIGAFLALALAALNGNDPQIIRAAYLAMDLIARFVIVPLAFGSLVTGLVQSLGTSWGLFRHYWIVAKLVLTVFATSILLIKLRLIAYAAEMVGEAILPRADLQAAGQELALHAAGGLLVLLVPLVLSVYKPRGLTPYGRRAQQGLTQYARPLLQGPSTAASGLSLSITLRPATVLGFIIVALMAHILVFHLSAGHFGH